MTIKLTTTAESITHVKCIVYSDSGTGKTWLIQTAPKPVIISIEKGLLTLKDVKPPIPVIEIKNFEDLEAAYDFVTSDPRAKGFQTICLDSITDIAETVLAYEKENCKDARNAYGNYVDRLLPLIKKFRDIDNKHVYFTAKMKRTSDDDAGTVSYGPSMPGQQLGPNMPYIFDFCLVLKIGVDDDGKKFRYLVTDTDGRYIAKARGDALEEIEPADLGYIFKKALSEPIPKIEPEGGDKKKEAEKEEVAIEGSFEEDEYEDIVDEEMTESAEGTEDGTHEEVDPIEAAAQESMSEKKG